jgi:hypothetical protein
MSAPLPYRVYRMNDSEWWMARSLDEARTAYCACYGTEFSDTADARELTDDELKCLMFIDDESNPSARRTFREELERQAATATGAEFFATTEW